MAKSLFAWALSAALAVAPAAAGAALVLPGVPAQAAVAPAPAKVTVVHGVRGLVADVRVDGKLVLSGFAPERITDPLSLPAGAHRIQAWPTGAAASARPLLDTVVRVTAGSHVTLGIGLNAAGKPQVTAYDDNLAGVPGGATAVAVRDIAAAPPVRVTVDNRVLTASIEAPQQKVSAITPGSHAVAVLPITGSTPLVPPQNVPVVAGRAMVLYLIGSGKDNSLGWIAQTVQPTVASAAPRTVQTGVGPIETGAAEPVLPGLGGLALGGLLAGFLLRRRSRLSAVRRSTSTAT